MAYWLVVFGILGACYCGIAEKYDNYTLLRLYPSNSSQFDVVKDFQDPNGEIEILKHSRDINDSLDVLVPPEMMEMMQNFSTDNQLMMIKKEKYGRKFEEPILEERTSRRRVFRGNPAFEYHSFASINEILDNIQRSSPGILRVEYVGNSYEGRKLKLAKLSTNPGAGNPIIFIDAGIHAREWVAPATALYMIHRLATDPASRAELEGIDWYILPVVNPDGYEYTRSSSANRLWRKTRSRSTPSCFGVDGNRNYGYKWAVSGVSHDPCNTETFAGSKPFSEVETQIVRRIMLENAKRIKLYISLHSYGQYLVYPWGYTGDILPKTWRKLDKMAQIASAALVNAGGLPFKVLSAGKWYPAAGGSDDFAFGAVGVPYSYTMEVTDGYEFIFPQSQLPSTLPKFYHCFKAMANVIRQEFPNIRQN